MKDNDIQAFPCEYHAGMSLRDYFAGKALQAEIQVWNSDLSKEHRINIIKGWQEDFNQKDIIINDALAMSSYTIADAMLKARNL